MPRPGFVLDVDKSTPPTLFWRGEGFSLEQLPADRSRIIYGPEPLDPIDDVDAAIRHALLHPYDQDPLPALLTPGMKLTICFDDISLPLPPMRRPDARQHEKRHGECRARSAATQCRTDHAAALCPACSCMLNYQRASTT